MKSIRWSHLKFDLLAGSTVFLVAIPLCLGIALACGVPLLSGLISGMVGGICVGILSGSSLSVAGPAAGLMVVITSGISTLGSLESFLAAVITAGCIQICLGIMKLGNLARLVPPAVIEGMMAAIGVLLVFKQFPIFIGRSELRHFNFWIFLIGVSSLLILVFWDKIFSLKFNYIPGAFLVVVVGTITALVLNHWLNDAWLNPNDFVKIPILENGRALFEKLPQPSWQIEDTFNFIKITFLLAFVASIESLLAINAIEKLDPQKRHCNKNQELIAQGVGNIIAGFLGGLPITSVIVRSSVNLNAGAKSKISTIFHGCLIFWMVFWGAKYMSYVPLVSLASILMFTGFKLAHPRLFLALWRKHQPDFWVCVVTFIMIITLDLFLGVVAGIILNGVLIKIKFMRRIS